MKPRVHSGSIFLGSDFLATSFPTERVLSTDKIMRSTSKDFQSCFLMRFLIFQMAINKIFLSSLKIKTTYISAKSKLGFYMSVWKLKFIKQILLRGFSQQLVFSFRHPSSPVFLNSYCCLYFWKLKKAVQRIFGMSSLLWAYGTLVRHVSSFFQHPEQIPDQVCKSAASLCKEDMAMNIYLTVQNQCQA